MDDEIASIVEREVGESPFSVVRVDEGLLHETYDVSCETGRYVLQFDSDGERDDSLRRGYNCYITLCDSDIPVPEVVTETVTSDDGRGYTIVEKLQGTTGEKDISPERTRNAGRVLARTHEFERFDEAGWLRFEGRELTVESFEAEGLREWVLENVAESSTCLQNGGLETAGTDVEDVFDRFGGTLPEAFRPVFCHNDYSPDNVLFEDDAVTGVIDFDRAAANNAQRALTKAANCFWMHDPNADWNVRETFYDGYRERRNVDSTFERNEPLYRVETLANIVAALLDMDELSEYETGFYAEQIREAVEGAERTVR